MKNIKRLLAIAILTIISVPAVVNAYSVHSIGDYVNFYVSEEEKNAGIPDSQAKGLTGFVLTNTDGSSEKYIKTALMGMTVPDMGSYINPDQAGYDLPQLQSMFQQAFKSIATNKNTGEPYLGDFSQATDTSKGIDLLSKADIMTMFELEGTCDAGCNLTIENHKGTWGMFGSTLAGLHDAYINTTGDDFKYIALKETEGNTAWVIELSYTTNSYGSSEIAGAVLKKASFSDIGSKSFFIPVLYMNKEMECHEQEYKSMCYDCSGTYKWLMEGSSEASACTAVPGKTSEAECKNEACYDCNGEYKWFAVGQQGAECELIKSIDVKSKCAKTPKTGVEDYVLEFLIIVSVAALVLFVVRKNDLFKTI
jgi:hypothetical protein